MGPFSSMFNGLARSLSIRKGRNSENCVGREAAEEMAKEARKNELILRSSGTVNADGSKKLCCSLLPKREERCKPRLLHSVGGIWMPRGHDVLWGV